MPSYREVLAYNISAGNASALSVDTPIEWALSRTDLDPTEAHILLVLATLVEEDRLCWPSQGALAKVTGRSGRTVRRSLQQLCAKGLIYIGSHFDTDGARLTNTIKLLTDEEAVK